MGIAGAVGDDVCSVQPGDRVFAPFVVSCGYCEFCRKGLHTSCVNGDSWGGDNGGAQGEYVRAPHADGTLVRVPDSDADDEDVLTALLSLTDVIGTGHHAPVRAYADDLMADALDGTLDPSPIFTTMVGLDGIADGYRAMDGRDQGAGRTLIALLDAFRECVVQPVDAKRCDEQNGPDVQKRPWICNETRDESVPIPQHRTQKAQYGGRPANASDSSDSVQRIFVQDR